MLFLLKSVSFEIHTYVRLVITMRTSDIWEFGIKAGGAIETADDVNMTYCK